MDMSSLLVPCPACTALNRVPAERLAAGPVCGKCKAALFSGKPLVLEQASFDRHASRGDVPLLVDFWAPWCAPCRMMAPEFERAAQRLEPAFRLAKVDTEAQPALGARYSVRSIPTLILFKAGSEIARQSGAMSATDIERWARGAYGI
jgi:thioredoxin 2